MGISIMIVDSHLHVWSGDRSSYPLAEGRSISEPATAQLLIETMVSTGVDKAVIVQPAHYMYDHRYVTECLRAHPGRFAAIGLVDQKKPGAIDRLDELLSLGFNGLRIHLASRVEDPSEWATADQDALWRRMAATESSFCVFGPSKYLPALEPIISRHPDVRIVLDHLGGPPAPVDDPEGAGLNMALAMRKYPQVYVKLTPQGHKSTEEFPHKDLFDLYRRYYDAFGPQRLMWGTNFPGILSTTGYGPALEMFQDHLDFFTASERARLLGGTAREVWPELAINEGGPN
jgi:predicted TIM-barrel fold metal-dependent hydrolase